MLENISCMGVARFIGGLCLKVVGECADLFIG